MGPILIFFRCVYYAWYGAKYALMIAVPALVLWLVAGDGLAQITRFFAG